MVRRPNTMGLRATKKKSPRHSLQKVKRAELLRHLFFEAASDAVVIVDPRGLILQFNNQTEQLFGYRRDELINQPVEILVPERLRQRHVEKRRHYFKNPSPRAMGNVPGVFGQRKDGSEFPIDIALSPLPTDAGLFVAIAVRDMTRQRELEDELRQRTRELEDADRQKDQFLVMLAHELSSPLAAIAYSAEIVRHRLSTDEVRKEAMKIVLEQTNFMRRLVDDLTELARVRHGGLAVLMEPTDLAEVVRMAVAINQPLIERRRHTLEIVTPSSAVRAQGDAARLVQIVSNLLANAARYTPEGGYIRLSIVRDDSVAILKVTDDGIGIPQDMLTQVFKPFTRLEKARQGYVGGMGVGLAFVQRLVEMQGGTVEAFSKGEGQGSEFVVRLLLAQVKDGIALHTADGEHADL